MKDSFKKEPLRDWSCPSYLAEDGRAAKSSMPLKSSYGADGETWTTSRQMPGGQAGPGSPSLKQIDAARCQDPTPVRKRQF